MKKLSLWRSPSRLCWAFCPAAPTMTHRLITPRTARQRRLPKNFTDEMKIPYAVDLSP